MKTTTVRLDDGLAQILDEIAENDDRSASELVRAAIRDYVQKRAEEDPKYAERIDQIAQQQLRARAEEIESTLGTRPETPPSQKATAEPRGSGK